MSFSLTYYFLLRSPFLCQTDMREDYDKIVVPLTKKFPEIFQAKHFDFEAFKAMTAHVSSRAMDVDLFHVSALVPFADL